MIGIWTRAANEYHDTGYDITSEEVYGDLIDEQDPEGLDDLIDAREQQIIDELEAEDPRYMDEKYEDREAPPF